MQSVFAITTLTRQFDDMLDQREVMAGCDEPEHIFKHAIFNLNYFAALFAGDVVMVGFKWLCQLDTRRPATDGGLGDAKPRK